jgi:WD40 repeat protein
VSFSPDGKYVVTASSFTARIWEVLSGKELLILDCNYTKQAYSVRYSPDGNYMLSRGYYSAKIWDVSNGKVLHTLRGHTDKVNEASFSPDGKYVVTASLDSTARIWEVSSGKELQRLTGHIGWVYMASFSPNGKYVITACSDKTARIWEASSGKELHILNGHTSVVYNASFSPDGEYVVTASSDKTARIWEVSNAKEMQILKGHSQSLNEACFNLDGKYVVTASSDKTARIWDVSSGRELHILIGHKGSIFNVSFSPDGKYVVTASEDNTARIWEVSSGKELHLLKGHKDVVDEVSFSPDGKYLVTTSWDKTARIWEVSTGKEIHILAGHKNNGMSFCETSACFSPESNYLITTSSDHKSILWDAATGKQLFTRLQLNGNDWLVYDEDYHFDGTPGAIEKLYFVCGLEVIELTQLKNSLWVPNLVERIMNGEKINSTKLSDLEICDYIPSVERQKDSDVFYSYLIKPRSGGLGNVIVSMNNGAYIKKYKPEQLIESGSNFILNIQKAEIKQYFKIGESNNIFVTANTLDNEISSRGDKITVFENEISSVIPNIYGVFVGVSDYKGEEIDLTYAAKDAVDLANIFELSAKELMKKIEKDSSSQHVFVYNLNTGDKRTAFPDKNTIRETLLEIGKKTKPNDILMVFFSGHGVMQGETKKIFYFLTAEASSINEPANSFGISTDELAEWLKPEYNKAQKRILIFDACHSGQAINNLVKLGEPSQNYIASKGNDEEGQRIKNIDKLNEQTGFFILSASASGQSAYELSRYSQGLLTYSMLKTIKQNPSILDNNNQLDVSKWFNASQEMVKEEIRKQNIAKPQDPQIVSSNSFKIGVINDVVLNSISLAESKLIFSKSEFRNTALKLDNLKFRNIIDNEVSERSNNGSIAFISDYQGNDAYSLSGDYTIKGDRIKVEVMLIKGGDELVFNFSVNGNTNDLKKLSQEVVNQTIARLYSSKKNNQ